MANSNLSNLREFIDQHTRLFVLTGAGISVGSGIPTYRDHQGRWQRSDPIKHQEFIELASKRQRYWARSMVGWQPVKRAKPNAAHLGLAQIESDGRVETLVTQNVDRLHQQAGSRAVIDLHGRLDLVICLECGDKTTRAQLQPRLGALNPSLVDFVAISLPDGDADIDDFDMRDVQVPNCEKCGGILKPDVVFFGDNVPKSRVNRAFDALQKSDAVLVVGSSLQVYSGYRFCKQAHEIGIPIGCLNLGVTRADDLIDTKFEIDCVEAFSEIYPQHTH